MNRTLPLLIICLTLVTASCCSKDNAQDTPADMFCITAMEDGLEVSMQLYDQNYPHTTPSLLYSLDGKEWIDFIIGQSVVTIPESGARLYIKANERNTAFGCEPGQGAPFTANYNSFKFSRKAKVSGNIMYLLDGKDPDDASMDELAFYGLFIRDTLLVDASELLLPAKDLSEFCYTEMFEGTSISQAPELPATELEPYCYASMFIECNNLSVAPKLPAMKLANCCYNGMLAYCPRLATAPELPATELAEACYTSMFDGCTSLTVGPKLHATKLTPYCYAAMFKNCTSLTSLTCLATDTSADKCLSGWMSHITTNGTLHAAAGKDWTGLIPATWTVEY